MAEDKYPSKKFCKKYCDKGAFYNLNYIYNISLLSETEEQKERISKIRREKCDKCLVVLLS